MNGRQTPYRQCRDNGHNRQRRLIISKSNRTSIFGSTVLLDRSTGSIPVVAFVTGHVIGVVLFWIIFFPLYLVQRRKAPLRKRVPGTPRTPIAATAAVPTEPQFKKCPDCAETVRADARVCKHCHYRFESDPVTAEDA